MQSRSAIFELTGRPRRGSLNALYRATDVLFSSKDALEQHLSERECDLFALAESSKDKATLAKDIVWQKREAYEHQDKLDGGYLLRSDREDLSDAEIWETYVMLTRLETASLGVLAYHLLTAIEHRLRRHADPRSWVSVRDVLSTHQRLTIEYRAKTNDP